MLLSLRRQWVIVTGLAVVFFIGNILLLSKFSESFRNVVANTQHKDADWKTLDLLVGTVEPNEIDFDNVKTDEQLQITQLPPVPQIVPLSTGTHTKKQVSDSITTTATEIATKFKIVILVIACDRPSVGRCLDKLLEVKPKGIDMPILVSQDCGHDATAKVIQSYGKKVKHLKHPFLGEVRDVPPHMRHFMGYYKISRHYKWALTQAFSVSGVDSVIIVEDDLDIAPDFFDYFLATRPLLDKDPSLYCISAWNDNGKEGYVKDNSVLYRTDFFPGLGWMLTKKVWEEFQPKWPKGFWDDWIRHPLQRKGRSCIAPEISRTKTFGRVGVSMGQFFDAYLKYIKLNKDPYPFLQHDQSYLMKNNYDLKFLSEVYNSAEIPLQSLLQGNINIGPVRITYNTDAEFEQMAKQFGIMHDLKAGVPRMAYKGIVTFLWNSIRIYLAPPKDWRGYTEN